MLSAGQYTHEKVWGLITAENSWRGRYEQVTALCSIAPPLSYSGAMPPNAIVDMLKVEFNAVRYYYVHDGQHLSLSPNPQNNFFWKKYLTYWFRMIIFQL